MLLRSHCFDDLEFHRVLFLVFVDYVAVSTHWSWVDLGGASGPWVKGAVKCNDGGGEGEGKRERRWSETKNVMCVL